MTLYPYKPVPGIATTGPGVYGDHVDLPSIPPWPAMQPFERQQWLDEFRAMRAAIDRLTDAQMAAIATGKKLRIRVKAGSRKVWA